MTSKPSRHKPRRRARARCGAFPTPAFPLLGAAAARHAGRRAGTPVSGDGERWEGGEVTSAAQGQIHSIWRKSKTTSSVRNEGQGGQGGRSSERAALLRRNRFGRKGDAGCRRGACRGESYLNSSRSWAKLRSGSQMGGVLEAFTSSPCPRCSPGARPGHRVGASLDGRSSSTNGTQGFPAGL